MLATKCEAGAGDVLKSCITLRKQTAKRRMQKGGSRVPRTGCISRLAFDLLQIAWSGSHAPLRKFTHRVFSSQPQRLYCTPNWRRSQENSILCARRFFREEKRRRLSCARLSVRL